MVLGEKHGTNYLPYTNQLRVSSILCKSPNWCKIELLSLEICLCKKKEVVHGKLIRLRRVCEARDKEKDKTLGKMMEAQEYDTKPTYVKRE